MKKVTLSILSMMLALSVPAFAQSPATQDTQPRTGAAGEQANPPLAGANSFSQDQAGERISKAGYTEVAGLTKDQNGIWRGTAMKSGQKYNVALDYKGNIVQTQ